MAEKPIRVLFRFTFGQPARNTPAEQRQQFNAGWMPFFKKWKAAGVKLLSSWMAPGGELEGYCHYLIFEMKDLEQLSQFNQEFNQSGMATIVDRYSVAVGDINQPWDGYWAQS
ncbi:MAG: hypothetical protein GXY76_01385 [Chloroflexi bacterium]|nr:hypothetical protein [Chloroflexota bacterium]